MAEVPEVEGGAPERPTYVVPVSVQVVAVLFILQGLWASIEMLIRLTQGRLFFDLSVLGCFVGIGLVVLKNGWRQCAIVLGWLGVVLVLVVTWLLLMHEGPLTLTLFGEQSRQLPKRSLWIVVPSALLLLAWGIWTLSRADVRELFHRARDRNFSLEIAKPGWTVLWVGLILVVGIAQAKLLRNMSKEYYIWIYHSWQPCSAGPQYSAVPREWENESISWHSRQHRDEEIVDRRSYEITAVAILDEEEIARFRCMLELAVQRDRQLVSFCMKDRSPPLDSRYAIRSTFFYSVLQGEAQLAVVTPEYDRSGNRVFLPDEFANGGSTSTTMPGKPCPALRFSMNWVWVDRRYRRPGIDAVVQIRDLRADGVPKLPAPRGMFPGTTQPIHWILEVRPEDKSIPTQRFEIPAGAHESSRGMGVNTDWNTD